jgi:hypothetical protein
MVMPKTAFVPLLAVRSTGFEVFDAGLASRVVIRSWCCVRRGEAYYLRGEVVTTDSDKQMMLVEFPGGQRVWVEVVC